ncbi:hypothetical protein [Marinoscillum sp.]|uniref:hypothetical protein n=1 Tax=Marinoscillum sp. TaxID=2024838 RepID=UPI003BA9E055
MSKALIIFTWWTVSTFNGWDTLQQLEVRSAYDDLLGETFDVPVFSDELKQFDGKEVTIEGYTIPLQQSTEQDYFVLSRFPYNNCFFCGNAGPETVAEVYTNKPITTQDARVRVTGKLKLNDADPLHLFFILQDASVEVLD